MAEAKAKKEKVPGEVKCAYCDGSGKHKNDKCVVCGGTGKVNVVDTTQKCQYCKGKGYLMPGTPCSVCHGTGYTRPVSKQRMF